MTGQLALDRRAMLGGLALGLGGALAACGSRAGAQGALAACARTPTETRGPFPADGSNGRPPINALRLAGIERQDIRASFAGLAGRAEGVPVDLELTLTGTGAGCGARGGLALYMWQNDAAGAYSLYDLREANYLRGLQVSGADGRVRFTSIVPGCYGGRYPHAHFEVYASAAGALAGAAPLLVSQLAFPDATCRTIYAADGRYGESLRNLERQPLARDFVFSDTGAANQMLALSGDARSGYRGTLSIAV